jgi:dachs protein
MRFKAFNLRYRLLAPFRKLRRADDKAMDDCHLILQCLQQAMEEQPKLRQCAVSNSWALGKRHIFLRYREILEYVDYVFAAFNLSFRMVSAS